MLDKRLDPLAIASIKARIGERIPYSDIGELLSSTTIFAAVTVDSDSYSESMVFNLPKSITVLNPAATTLTDRTPLNQLAAASSGPNGVSAGHVAAAASLPPCTIDSDYAGERWVEQPVME